MNRTSIRAATLACALLGTTAIVSPALAQAGAPPVRYQYDENGVDVAHGTWATYVTDLAIGPEGRGGLSFIRGFGQPVAANNWGLIIYQDVTGTTVSVGFKSYSFSQSGSTYTSTDGSGATLVQSGSTFTLTEGDGTVVVYGYTLHDSNDGFVVKARGTTITYPTGEKMTLTWNTLGWCSSTLGCPPGSIVNGVRLQAVSSSLGYQLHFFYGKDDVIVPSQGTGWRKLNTITAFNTAVDYCDPAGFTCSFSQTWPSVSYATFETVTDPMGRSSIYHLASNGWTIQRPSSSSANLAVTVDSNFNVASVTRDGMTWNYSYSVSGTTATMTVTDPLSHVRTIISDTTVGLPTSIQNEVSQTTAYHYDSSGRLDKVTAPETNYVQYTYDSRGNMTQVLAHPKTGSGLSDITTSAVYPSSCTNAVTCNLPTSTTDARGKTTDYTYDSTHGGLLTVTLPAPTTGATRPQTRYTYSALQAYYKNSSGSIVASGVNTYRATAVSSCQTGSSCAGTSDEVKTTVAYGSTGVANNLLPTSVSSGAGDGSLTSTTATTYDAVGNPYTVDGPLSGSADTARLVYDADRELVGTIGADPDGAGSLKNRAVRVTYNTDGLVTKVEQGTTLGQTDTDWAGFSSLQAVETDYDSADRPVVQRLTSGGTTYALAQTSYDGEGRPVCGAQRMNPTFFTSLPSDACTLGTTSSSYGPDRIVKTTYDAAGRVTLVQSAYGVTGVQSDDLATTYTNNGLVSTVTDAEGNKTTYGYDGLDRRTTTFFPNTTKGAGTSSSTDYEQLTLDANGNVTSRRLRDGNSIGYSYDALNRLTFKDLPGTEPDVTYAYDLLNRMTGASQTGNSLSFSFDALGRKLAETGPQGTVTSVYDIAGRRTQLTWPDSYYVNYDYLVTGEVSAIRENGATSGISVLTTYAYDGLGRRTLRTYGNGTTTSFGYDSASRLTSLGIDIGGTSYDNNYSYGYNPSGQIIQATQSNDSAAWGGHGSGNTSSTTNGLNQLSAVGSTTPTYDSKGNLTSAGGTTYGYSSENLLTSTTSGVSLAYDPAMRLYQVAGGAPGTQRFVYDGDRIIAEYDGSNTFNQRYIYGPDEPAPLVMYWNGGALRYFENGDERGSIVTGSFSDASGAGFNHYDEYGKPGTYNGSYFQYTGQLYLPELGLYYYKARMYASGLGRFMQTDPIGYGAGMNVYAYTGGDPENNTDPAGLDMHHMVCKDDCGASGLVPGMTTGSRIYTPGDFICGSCSGSSTASITGGTPTNGDRGGGGTGAGANGSWWVHRTEYSDHTFQDGQPYWRSDGLFLADWLNGMPTFGGQPSIGQARGFFSSGRIVSRLPGGFAEALAATDTIAGLNNIPLLSSLPVGVVSTTLGSFFSVFPVLLGQDWYTNRNPVSGFINVWHSPDGLNMRFHGPEINVDIPPGFLLPNGRSTMWETVHFGGR